MNEELQRPTIRQQELLAHKLGSIFAIHEDEVGGRGASTKTSRSRPSVTSSHSLLANRVARRARAKSAYSLRARSPT